jgi:MarR family transcriptional regulator, multiple antibiotic resistance protein MarR
VRKRVHDLLEPEFAPLGLTPVQAIVILGIASGTTTAAGFSKLMQHDPGAMTRVIDRLEKAGYVRRVRNPGDRRSSHLELTDAGRKALPRLRSGAVKVFNHMLRRFSNAEAKQLIAYLKRLAADA